MKKLLGIFILFLALNIQAQNQIIGILSDAKSGKPLENVQIFIPELQKGCLSEKDGTYQLNKLPDGIFKIQYSYLGYQTHIESIQLKYNSKIHLNIALSQAYIQSQEIIVSAGGFSSQHENAIKVESIKLNALEEHGGLSMVEKLSNIPGIAMISKGKGIVTPVIRGLSTTNIILLNNGVRMENFQFSENHPFMINEAGIDQVELIKGPASLLYGSDAIGGVINVIREKPAPVGKIIGDFHLKYFTNTKGIQSNLGIKGSHGDFFWGIRANQKSHCDYRQAKAEYVPNTRFNEQSAHVFLGMNRIFGSFKIYYDYDQMKLGLAIPQSIDIIDAGGRENHIWYQDLKDHMLISKNKIFLGSWQIESDISYQNNNRLLNTTTDNEHFTATDMLLQTLNYNIKAHWDWTTKRSIIFGYQGMSQVNNNSSAPSHVLPDYHLLDNSVFTLFQQYLGKKLHAQLGIRYDYRIINVPEQEKSGNNQDLLPRLERNYNNVSASLGFTYELSEKLLLRSNFASGYRTPNIAELTQDGMHSNRYEKGNADLKAQRNYELDLSSHLHIEKVKFDIALFYNYIRDYIYLSPTNDSLSNGMKIYQYQQNTSSIYGIETGIEYFPHSWVHIKTTYAHLIGQQDNGNYLPFIPQDKMHFNIKLIPDIHHNIGGFYISIESNLVFKQDKPSPFETPTDFYALFNIMMGSKIKISKQNIQWRIILNNILDETYVDHLSTLKTMSYNDMGRNITLSIKIPFSIKY